MKIAVRFILIFFLFSALLYGQENKVRFADVVKAFNRFQYKEVVGKSTLLLKQEKKPGQKEMLELLRMKAIAHYVLNEEDMAALSFVEILKINPQYRPDPLQNSPKLIAFFNKVKENYKPPEAQKKPVKTSTPSQSLSPDLRRIKGAVMRSLALPGWGHLYNGQKGRGALLTGAAVLSLSGALYLTIRTNDLEKKYLNAIPQSEIDKRYKTYNRFYNLRNGTLALYALVWIYAQFDLSSALFNDTQQNLSVYPAAIHATHLAFGLDLKFSF